MRILIVSFFIPHNLIQTFIKFPITGSTLYAIHFDIQYLLVFLDCFFNAENAEGAEIRRDKYEM